MFKKINLLAFIVLLCAVPLACSAQTDETNTSSNATASNQTQTGEVTMEEWNAQFLPQFEGVLQPDKTYRAIVTMEDGSHFTIEFYPDAAPNHVANFVSLARDGYYDGVTFHRVIPGFMAQGGDPTGTGSGGPGYRIPAEFNDRPHVRGTVSMARTQDPNSAGSQFFICFQETPYLDGQYTVFGQVIEGMEAVDSITVRDPQQATTPGDKMVSVEIIELDEE